MSTMPAAPPIKIFFRLPKPIPNPITDPNPNPKINNNKTTPE